MAYATVDQSGDFTGTVYSEMTQTVKDWHDDNGFSYVKVEDTSLPNLGTDEEPDYGRPTESQNKEAQRLAAKKTRDEALNAMTYTYSDGAVVQVRPGDLPNFQTAIQLGGDHKWIMADNTVRLTSATELTEALNSGITQGKVIWDAYAADVEAIV